MSNNEMLLQDTAPTNFVGIRIRIRRPIDSLYLRALLRVFPCYSLLLALDFRCTRGFAVDQRRPIPFPQNAALLQLAART